MKHPLLRRPLVYPYEDFASLQLGPSQPCSTHHPSALLTAPSRPLPHNSHRSNLNGFGTPLPAGGLAYWALPAQGSDTFESSGVNSAGVAISATETIYFK